MEGYFLFRGDILVAGKPGSSSAEGLWQQGMEGDILVILGYLGMANTLTLAWTDSKEKPRWHRIYVADPERYRVLILLQQ